VEEHLAASSPTPSDHLVLVEVILGSSPTPKIDLQEAPENSSRFLKQVAVVFEQHTNTSTKQQRVTTKRKEQHSKEQHIKEQPRKEQHIKDLEIPT
jgi:hypothetical protein